MREATVERVMLPALSPLGPEPRIPGEVYRRRQSRLRQDMVAAGLDLLIVYADREHSANASYLTGFDPRFEEALILLDAARLSIATGNESIALVADCPGEVAPVLCQAFSLPGQDRSLCATVEEAIAEAGVARSARAGLVGWKPIPPSGDEPRFAVPAFVVDALGSYLDEPVSDRTAWLRGPAGARTRVGADQLALQEHRATRASQHVWCALEALSPGRTELEVSAAMRLTGVPLSCHVMCTSGAAVVNGLRSPSDRAIGYGDRFYAAVGLWGGLCARAGRVLSKDDPELDRYVEQLAAPYAAAQRLWYESLRLGADAGAITRAVTVSLARDGLRPLVNPGHFVHLDEWTHSTFRQDSTTLLRSGTALQCDIIPVSPDPGAVINCEDTVALADADLQEEVATRYPAMWGRVTARREFMRSALAIDLAPEVLPLSDRQGVIPAGLLALDSVVKPAR